MKKLMTLTICMVMMLMSCTAKDMPAEPTETENRPYLTHPLPYYYPGAKERPSSGSLVKFEKIGDGIDNDGDSEVDELEEGMWKACVKVSTGGCELGTRTYMNDEWGPCIGAVYPTGEKD